MYIQIKYPASLKPNLQASAVQSCHVLNIYYKDIGRLSLTTVLVLLMYKASSQFVCQIIYLLFSPLKYVFFYI